MARSVRITSRTADFFVATETTCFNAPLADKIFVNGYLLKSPEKRRRKKNFISICCFNLEYHINNVVHTFFLNLDKGAI